jgi:hypothetical protein
MPIFAVSILVQVALVVHVIKTGRPTYWIFILLFFPLVGALAYAIIELLPAFTGHHALRRSWRKVGTAINPQGELRAAEEQYDIAATVQNAMLLAEQYLAHSRCAEAKQLYMRNLSGVHADDPRLLLGLASAHYGLGEYNEALTCLDLLKAKNPRSTDEAGHLLYAKCLLGMGRTEEAVAEFEALATYYPGPEPACRLALIYESQGNREKARALFEDILKRSRRAGHHYRYLHGEWLAIARDHLRG